MVDNASGEQLLSNSAGVARPALGPPAGWTGSGARTTGWVVIPDHVDPTNPQRVYELDDPAERKYVYEVVLADGTVDDVSRLIDLTFLAELWERLYLPRRVRAAWQPALDSRVRQRPDS